MDKVWLQIITCVKCRTVKRAYSRNLQIWPWYTLYVLNNHSRKRDFHKNTMIFDNCCEETRNVVDSWTIIVSLAKVMLGNNLRLIIPIQIGMQGMF
jgi:hypothetical protein